MKKVMMVGGMSCGHCEAAVKKSLLEVQGVQEVAVDLGAGRVEVTGEKLDSKTLKSTVEDAGYEVLSLD